MLATETIVPVYFAMEDDELLSIYTQTLTSSSSQGSLSAAEGRDFFHPNRTFFVTLKHMRPPAVISCSLLCLYSAVAYSHSQWLSNGHQWSSE